MQTSPAAHVSNRSLGGRLPTGICQANFQLKAHGGFILMFFQKENHE